MADIHTKEQGLTKAKTLSGNPKKIIIHNDEVNTFDFVIDCLINICNHNMFQAEQCTYIIHYKGKCVVKEGAQQSLEPLVKQLANKGLTVSLN